MICVIATIEVTAGRREEFLEAFRQIVPKVRAEEGCLEYAPMIDLETSLPAQPPARPDVTTIVEKWSDLEALEAHLMTPHMIEYRKAVKELVVGMTLQVLQSA